MGSVSKVKRRQDDGITEKIQQGGVAIQEEAAQYQLKLQSRL
jgi:hypothetical protein